MRHLARFALAALVLTLLALPAQGLNVLSGRDAADSRTLGVWEPAFEGEAPAVNMAVLHDGSVLYWSGVEAGDRDGVFFTSAPEWAQVRLLSPPYTSLDVWTPADPQGAAGDLFCSGHTILPDGRVLAVGGSEWTLMTDGTTDIVRGLKDSRIFDPATGAWTRVADMSLGRWYPTILTDADGNALVASGIQNLTNPITLQTGFERYDAIADAWLSTPDAEDRLLPMYPRLFVVPGGPMKGDLFYQTVGTLWGPFGEHPLEPLWSLQQVADQDTGEWRYLGPSAFGARQHGVSVMLPLDPEDGYSPKLLTFGGTLQRSVAATAATELADLRTDPPTNTVLAPMNVGRWHANGVILPDGSVLAVGGGLTDNVVVHGQRSPPVMVAEQWNPETREWETRAEMKVPRTYHSTAILLPDGRVLAGGHVPLPVPWTAIRDNVPMEDQIAETRLEIYSPPYLFRGERPVILSATPEVAYGGRITVTTPDADEIESAILIRPGATTHAWDSSERAVNVEIESVNGDALTLRAPPDGDVAAPGYWMLFVNKASADGPIPSVAEFVKIG